MSAPLIFLPGWGLGRGLWRAAAAARGGEVLDLPGYGGAPSARDFDAAADDLAGRIPAGAGLCGWSLGAMLALAAAARAPSKVGRLVLVAGTASFVRRDGWDAGLPAAALAEFAAAVAADPDAALPRFVANFNRGDARAKALTREARALADPSPPAGTLAAGLDWLAQADLRPLAPAVRAPTLLVHGAADPLTPLAAGQALAAMIPGAGLEVMAGCAHAPFLSDPARFHAALDAFLP